MNLLSKSLMLILLPLFLCFAGCNSEEASSGNHADPIEVTDVVVEAACGQCKFDLSEPAGCDLAVRIDGKSYFVDGTTIDDHGDAHAADGMCMMVREAKVSGKVVDGRFVADKFELLPKEDDKE